MTASTTQDHPAPSSAPGQVLTLLRTISRWLSTALLVVLMAGVTLAGWGVGSGQWRAHPVLSGSMEPGLPTGSIAVVRQVPTVDLQVGDVIVFHEPGNPNDLVTHRIASIATKDGARVYETKGDANARKDPWEVTLRGDTSNLLTSHVPYAGYAVVWLRQPEARTWLYTAAAVLLGYAVLQLFLPEQWWRRRAEVRAEPIVADNSEGT